MCACAGYYYDPGSGYYYDATSGLYFDSGSQQWLALDPETGQFSIPPPETAVSTAAESTIGEPASLFSSPRPSVALIKLSFE